MRGRRRAVKRGWEASQGLSSRWRLSLSLCVFLACIQDPLAQRREHKGEKQALISLLSRPRQTDSSTLKHKLCGDGEEGEQDNEGEMVPEREGGPRENPLPRSQKTAPPVSDKASPSHSLLSTLSTPFNRLGHTASLSQTPNPSFCSRRLRGFVKVLLESHGICPMLVFVSTAGGEPGCLGVQRATTGGLLRSGALCPLRRHAGRRGTKVCVCRQEQIDRRLSSMVPQGGGGLHAYRSSDTSIVPLVACMLSVDPLQLAGYASVPHRGLVG